MTDEQIIKALECCANCSMCEGYCPYDEGHPDLRDCTTILAKDALALFKRKKEDIEWAQERILNAEKRIEAQREELRRLNKAHSDTIQARDGWKKEAKRIGNQLYEVLEENKQEKKLYDDRSFQEEMWSVLGDMTYAQAREAVR